MNEMSEYNPLLAPDAKEKLTNILEEALHDFKFRLKSSARAIAKNLLAYDTGLIGLNSVSGTHNIPDKYNVPEPEGNGLIDIELKGDQFQLDAFVDQYIENEAPSVSTTIKFFEGNQTLNDATVTVTLDSNYWDEDELEMCAFRLTANFEEVDPFKVKSADNLSDKELEILEKSSQVGNHLYDSLETIYDFDVYQMKISHIVTQD